MHLATKAEKSAEAHDQGTPEHRIDAGARTVPHQQPFIDVQFHDLHLKHVGAHILAERAEILDDTLHLYRTLAHPRWGDQFRPDRSEPGDAEFVRLIAIAPLTFLFRHGLLPVVSASRST